MAFNTDSHYSAENRTATPHSQVASTQAWKNFAREAQRFATVETRTAAAPVHVGKPFHAELANASSAPGPRTFETALSMAEAPASSPAAAAPTASSDFSFGDVIDVINPLQHLPVVGMIYRELTGDDIGPVAQIVGGGIYGGPLGAVSGTVNAVVQETTGKDIGGNVLALVIGDDGVAVPADAPAEAPASINRDDPEMALSLASAQYTGEKYLPAVTTQPDMPETAMGFAAHKAAQAYEKAAVADGRTAGWMPHKVKEPAIDVDYTPAKITLDALPPREAITVLPMNTTPAFGGLY